MRPRGGPPPSAWVLSNKPRMPLQQHSKFAQAQRHDENECELDSEAQLLQWQRLGGRRQQMVLVRSWCTATSCAGQISNGATICRAGHGAVSWALAAAHDTTNTTLTALRGTAVERAASKAFLVLRQLERSIGTSVAAIVCDFVRQRGAPPTLTAERRAVLAGGRAIEVRSKLPGSRAPASNAWQSRGACSAFFVWLLLGARRVTEYIGNVTLQGFKKRTSVGAPLMRP